MQISELGGVLDEIAGLAIYVGDNAGEYLFVALLDSLVIYSPSNFALLGSALFSEELELGDIAIYQPPVNADYPDGIITYAMETNSGGQFGVSSLSSLFTGLSLRPNRSFDPRRERCKLCTPKTTPDSCAKAHNCASNGFCATSTTCACFSGFTGASCGSITCPNSCSSHGMCVSAGVCSCTAPWGGPDCSFLLVHAKYETDENGGDGDDPAIWIAPGNKTGSSRIITTTKSELGAGFGIFDLAGKKIQTIAAAEPNNVDVIYGFTAGNRTVDLVFAACRGDNTLWYTSVLEILPLSISNAALPVSLRLHHLVNSFPFPEAFSLPLSTTTRSMALASIARVYPANNIFSSTPRLPNTSNSN